MLKLLDSLLNRITMYRLVLYGLLCLLGAAFIFSLFGWMPFGPLMLLFSVAVLVVVGWAANVLFAAVFEAPANIESVYITALILALIITPVASLHDSAHIAFLGWAAVLAVASKFIFAIRKKHIFNPAAFAVAVTAVAINQSASWWVATAAMAPFVLIFGLLVVRKIRRADLAVSFFIAALVTILAFDLLSGVSILDALRRTVVDTPILFFAFVMLTEPATTPPTRRLRVWYGVITGILFAPQFHIAAFYPTPELALLMGNVFSYVVSPKDKLILQLKKIVRLTADTFEFVFISPKQLAFAPGQYLEWTLGHENADSRGNRRYFTIASSPTKKYMRLGVKFYPQSSSYKTNLLAMKAGDTIVASQLAGDFTLPKDSHEKLVFIAGGIGITPFRSMVQYLLDIHQRRDVVLFYSNRTIADIAYKEVFDLAAQAGVKTIYTLTDTNQIQFGWKGETGYIDERMIAKHAPDFKFRTFYISGPQAMVSNADDMLRHMGIHESQIKKDFFPGFA